MATASTTRTGLISVVTSCWFQRLPFRGETSTSTLAKILESDPEPPSVVRQGLPPDLERIIRRCLEKQPANRYNDTRDLVADLRSLETTGESPIVRATAGGGIPTRSRIWLTAVAVVIALVFLVWRPWSDRARDVQQIGRDLGVRYLLDGSVRRAGDQVRVSAQLVDGETGRNLWSEDFDGTLEDVFAVQERTALEIANRLDLELSPEEQCDVQRRSTENVAAYDAYLQGLALSREWGVPEQLERAVVFFERALELDPDFAEALAGLSAVESDLYRTFDPSEERIERVSRPRARATRSSSAITRQQRRRPWANPMRL